jgi:hypothetical protein
MLIGCMFVTSWNLPNDSMFACAIGALGFVVETRFRGSLCEMGHRQFYLMGMVTELCL